MFSKAVMGLSLAVMAFLAIPAQAVTILPVLNPTFSYAGPTGPKNTFAAIAPTSWHVGAAAPTSDLLFIDAPGTATSSSGGYAVYGPFNNPPSGGNFIQADGNPNYERVFYQTITGLTVGQHYQLSFWQAAGQQTSFSGATTEQWVVSLGKNALTYTVNNTTKQATYTNADAGASIVKTHLMNTASHGVYDWEQVTIDLVADNATQILSFLAWGNGGSTINQPPTVFLAGINTAKVPEPFTLSLFSVGLAGLALRRRKNAKAA
jgi:hypothetical protein